MPLAVKQFSHTWTERRGSTDTQSPLWSGRSPQNTWTERKLTKLFLALEAKEDFGFILKQMKKKRYDSQNVDEGGSQGEEATNHKND